MSPKFSIKLSLCHFSPWKFQIPPEFFEIDDPTRERLVYAPEDLFHAVKDSIQTYKDTCMKPIEVSVSSML